MGAEDDGSERSILGAAAKEREREDRGVFHYGVERETGTGSGGGEVVYGKEKDVEGGYGRGNGNRNGVGGRREEVSRGVIKKTNEVTITYEGRREGQVGNWGKDVEGVGIGIARG